MRLEVRLYAARNLDIVVDTGTPHLQPSPLLTPPPLPPHSPSRSLSRSPWLQLLRFHSYYPSVHLSGKPYFSLGLTGAGFYDPSCSITLGGTTSNITSPKSPTKVPPPLLRECDQLTPPEIQDSQPYLEPDPPVHSDRPSQGGSPAQYLRLTIPYLTSHRVSSFSSMTLTTLAKNRRLETYGCPLTTLHKDQNRCVW